MVSDKTLESYKPSFWFKNGHLNTLFPYFFRKNLSLGFERIPIDTSDNDFIHIDIIKDQPKGLVILCHGLEGSSASQYIQGTAKYLLDNGWNIAAMNYRFCSGVINKQPRIYHSGATDDLYTVVQHFESAYQFIALVGFSLGGNLVLKYLGENRFPIPKAVKVAVGISVPTDLEAGSLQISKPSNYIYQNRFLKSLGKKIQAKHQQYPELIDLSLLKQTKTLYDFDDLFTGPIHGFMNAHDYYSKCSSKQFIRYIDKPTLIINALDDPFLPAECYPIKESQSNSSVELLTPRYGGHVGFVTKGSQAYWNEKMILHFIDKRYKTR